MGNVSQAIPATFQNHYSEDLGILAGAGVAGGGTGGTYFQGQPSYNVQPINYHLYAAIGPHADNLTPYQKSIHDLFLSDRLREDLQRKSEAVQQVMPSKHKKYYDGFITNQTRCPSEHWCVTVFILFSRRSRHNSE